jgi:glycosyl transferase family 25
MNDLVKHIYCINLDRREDRWKESVREFEKHSMAVTRFRAIDGNIHGIEKENGASDGDIGCTLSHLELVRELKANNIHYALVLEDDVTFIDNFNSFFSQFIFEVPEDWDMIYLGGNHVGDLTPVSDHVFKTTKTFTTHAYLIKNTVYDEVIRLHGQGKKQVDVYYAEIHEKYNCYVIRPHLAWQRESYSDIQGANVEYKFLRDVPHYYKEIDGWFDFDDLYTRMVNEFGHGSHFVEVGSWLGKSSCYMAVELKNSKKDIKFDCVDLWSVDGNDPFYNYYIERIGDIFQAFQNNISQSHYEVGIKRMPSVYAAKSYEDQSLDFVFIDANHSYEFVKQDIEAWLPKVKPGGYIGGHDYSGSDGHKGVVKAVDEAFPEKEIIGTSWLVKL